MNKHVNKNKTANIIDLTQFKALERDHMPSEVATELLAKPGMRATNRERKTWNDARATVYTSLRTAIPEEERTANQLKGLTWLQLDTQLRRAVEKRAQVQRHLTMLQRQFAKVEAKKNSEPLQALFKRQITALNLTGTGLEAYRDAIETEIERRNDFCAHLRTVAPSVAKNLRRKLCGR